jgi:hypothetical protein
MKLRDPSGGGGKAIPCGCPGQVLADMWRAAVRSSWIHLVEQPRVYISYCVHEVEGLSRIGFPICGSVKWGLRSDLILF